jgi:hypothetical protein
MDIMNFVRKIFHLGCAKCHSSEVHFQCTGCHHQYCTTCIEDFVKYLNFRSKDKLGFMEGRGRGDAASAIANAMSAMFDLTFDEAQSAPWSVKPFNVTGGAVCPECNSLAGLLGVRSPNELQWSCEPLRKP